MESIGNKALLPKLENISKGEKTLKELRPYSWLLSEVLRTTGITESDIDKYSDIINIEDLIAQRVTDYKTVFSVDRISMLNSSKF